MSKPKRYGALLLLLAVAIVFFWWKSTSNDNSSLVTTTVEKGDILEVVSVSGFVEADNTANLAFPTTGRISEIYVEEGDIVSAGTLLASIGQSQLAAERKAAVANLSKAEATREQLLNGQTTEERAVTDATVAQAKAAWEQTVATELQKIRNAQIAINSNDLIAYPEDTEEDSLAPTVSGSYVCAEEGEYVLDIYRSSSDSGFSMQYNGLERGTAPVTYGNPTPIGTCGLSVQFTEENTYENSQWKIFIPNVRSNTYLTYVSALALAEQQAAQNIQAAKDVLTLAENTATRDTAAPRIEALISANAVVSAAQAELARIDARIGDYGIYAPFDGMVTNVDKRPGEIATTEPFITLLAEDAFTLQARIPEIDITRVEANQIVDVVFDANPSEALTGEIAYVSPLAVEIDGVAYFEAQIELTQTPNWIKSGLNADIDIIVASHRDVLRIPKRFITSQNGETYVIVLDKKEQKQTTVETGAEGNDGHIEVTNIIEGTTLVAP